MVLLFTATPAVWLVRPTGAPKFCRDGYLGSRLVLFRRSFRQILYTISSIFTNIVTLVTISLTTSIAFMASPPRIQEVCSFEAHPSGGRCQGLN